MDRELSMFDENLPLPKIDPPTNDSKVTIKELHELAAIKPNVEFVKSGDDLILQEDLRNGTGIFLVDITETNSSGTFTVTLPSNILSNTDDNFELDGNNDFALKT